MDKRKLLEDVFKEYSEVCWASNFIEQKGTSFYTVYDALEELESQGKKPTFSNLRKCLKARDPQGDSHISEDITVAMNIAGEYKKYFDFFDPDFQFADDAIEFRYQLHVMLVMFCFADASRESFLNEGIPEIDAPEFGLAIMKALFHAGKMIERLKFEGKKRGDFPAEAGGKQWKERVPNQDIIKIYHESWLQERMEKRKMSKNQIYHVIQEELLKREKEKERGDKARKVYSVKQIGRILRPELDKLKK